MYRFYQKSPLGFALAWIGIYCGLQSLGSSLSGRIGIPGAANGMLALLQSVFLLVWLRKHGLLRTFHLNKPNRPAGNMLYYLPLLLVSTSNLWLGVANRLTPAALGFHLLLMACVGFLEELLFRGFLFEALRKDSLRSAVVISSLTFGAGHILNLFNGRGMEVWEVLVQILFAVLLGFLYAMVCLRSGSLIPCILSHGTINILSAFAVPDPVPSRWPVRLGELAIVVFYLLVLKKTAPINLEDLDT